MYRDRHRPTSCSLWLVSGFGVREASCSCFPQREGMVWLGRWDGCGGGGWKGREAGADDIGRGWERVDAACFWRDWVVVWWRMSMVKLSIAVVHWATAAISRRQHSTRQRGESTMRLVDSKVVESEVDRQQG